MSRISGFMWAALAACLLTLPACTSNETPSNEVLVLVDLSETWLNPQDKNRDGSVVSELGYGVVGAMDALPTPMVVQYRIIGGASYEQPPACDVLYQPTLISTGKRKPSYLITKRSKLEQYLGADCPALLLNRPAEALTEISAALASAVVKPKASGTRRTLIVVSDFLEEAPEATSLDEYDLRGVRALLLYRPLHGEIATSTRQRVGEWQSILRGRGADVTVWPDTALKRADVTAYLTQR